MNGTQRALAAAVAAHACGLGVSLAAFLGTDLFLPMAGRQAGVHPSNWYTTVWIHNPGGVAATARVYLLERGTANLQPPWAEVVVAAGDTELVDNAVETLFGRQVFGALRVTCATQELLVSSRVYSRAPEAGARDSVGQDFAGVPASFAIGVGERTTILGVHQTQPSDASEFRYNFGFVETTGHVATVRVRAFDGDNADQGFVDLQVREWSQRQVAFRDHFPQVSTQNSRLEVEVIGGTGKVIAYGSLIANGAQDPTTFEASVALPPATFPSGAVMMFDLQTCPAGWSELVAARGRALVGVANGGTLAGTVGAPLTDLEDRQHTHVVNPEAGPAAPAGDHSHTVGPALVPTTGAGSHAHTVDVPWTESEGVPGHTHSVPGVVTTTGMSGSHNHKWSEFNRPCGGNCGGSWNSFDTNGTEFTVITYVGGDNPGLNQEGSGTFPLALADDPVGSWDLYTTDTTHQHTFEVPARTAAAGGIHAHGVNPVAFSSASVGAHSHDVSISATSTTAGSHFHTVDVQATESQVARTSAVMPYLQLLVCRKD